MSYQASISGGYIFEGPFSLGALLEGSVGHWRRPLLRLARLMLEKKPTPDGILLQPKLLNILLMDKILHHLGWLKPYK